MKLAKRTPIAFLSLATVSVLALSACGGTSSSPSSSSSSSSPAAMSSSAAPMTSSSTMDPAANLVGPGCAAYAAANPAGAGSVTGMAADPVTVAASNNPLLTTLVSAVSGKLNPNVDLVSTLNSAEFTIFAPVDDAFAKLDAATIESLKTDDATLKKILTYHVVPGQISPDKIVGEQPTVEGDTLTVTGDKNNLVVNGNSKVICGGVRTANATVYLVDTVLSPK